MIRLEHKDIFSRSNIAYAATIIVIAALAIYYRTTMLHFFGFYEPDGFYYFSVVRATVANHFVIPHYLNTSGYPYPMPVAEAHGVYWISLVPYSVLQYIGVSYYTIMRLMPVVFALLDMLGTYLLARYMSKDRLLGLLAMLFVALSMGNAARTSALIYRGDSFVTFFLLLSLAFFIEIYRQEGTVRKLAMACATAVALAMSNFVWNGASFADATILLAFAIVTAYAFMMRKEKVIAEGKYVLVALGIWWVLTLIAFQVGFIQGQQLVGLSFLPVLIPIALLWLAVYLITSRSSRFEAFATITRRPEVRVLLVIAGVALGLIAFGIIAPGVVYQIFVGNGFVTAPGSFGSTTQELQPPTFQFLFSSFSATLYTSIPSLLMAFTMYFAQLYTLWTAWYGIIGIMLLFIVFVPYLFMQVYDSGAWLSGKARIRLDLNVPMLTIMAYFILTAYLEMHVIRFNSLVSVPIAIVSAYTLYWIASYANQAKRYRLVFLGAAAAVIIVVAAMLLYYANLYTQGLVQADSINPQFISALQWFGQNSPSNASVLTLWPDGSVVEGVANRKVVTDSVGSENGSKATPFATWLFNSTPDTKFLTGPLSGKPGYILVRSTWLIETQGIYTESTLNPANVSDFGFQPLYSYSEQTVNATTRRIVFSGSGTYSYPYIAVTLAYPNTTSTSPQITGYVQASPTQILPFATTVFYNQDNANFSLVNQASRFNSTNGAMLLIQYSGVPRPGFYINLTGAYVFAPGMAQSNMLKLLYLCNNYVCTWDNRNATAQLTYVNPDTKILKITYNSTS